jgi:hypothetical protein
MINLKKYYVLFISSKDNSLFFLEKLYDLFGKSNKLGNQYKLLASKI